MEKCLCSDKEALRIYSGIIKKVDELVGDSELTADVEIEDMYAEAFTIF